MDQEMQKITVEVPKDYLVKAQEYSEAGLTATVRESLKEYIQRHDQLELRKLRGLYKPSISVEEMRSWEDD